METGGLRVLDGLFHQDGVHVDGGDGVIPSRNKDATAPAAPAREDAPARPGRGGAPRKGFPARKPGASGRRRPGPAGSRNK